jgi:hypothetical protein
MLVCTVCIVLQAPLAEGQQWIDDSFSANQSAIFIKQGDFSSGLSPYCGTHWTTPDEVTMLPICIMLIVSILVVKQYSSILMQFTSKRYGFANVKHRHDINA